MRVLVTGGTGYVGAHGVRALVDQGHQVHLLVRNPTRIDEVLIPLGVDRPSHSVGDLTDAAAVSAAMDGCDAVLHFGGVVSLARRDAAMVLATNPAAARNVIDAAIERGLDPIIHVSSVSALFTPGCGPVHAELPIASWPSAYGRSKALAEEHARRRQAEGAPVVITYPGGVAGPAAGPVTGAVNDSIAAMLRAGVMPLADARVSYVDARDLADFHGRLLVPGLGSRRFVCGGHTLDGPAIARVLRDVTGRRMPVLPVPGAVWRALGRGVDVAARVLPFDPVFTHEAMVLSSRWEGTDDGPAHDAGFVCRDPRETFGAAVDGLVVTGALRRGQAGSRGASR